MRLNLLILIGLTMAGLLAHNFWAGRVPGPALETPAALAGIALAPAPLPDFPLAGLEGAHYQLADYQGRIIVLNFWASWCLPCFAEFPELLALAAAYPDDLVLIALSTDTDRAAAARFLTMLDDDAAAQLALGNVVIGRDADQAISRELFQIYRLPETVITDRDHQMVHKIIGANWHAADIIPLLENLRTGSAAVSGTGENVDRAGYFVAQ